jgi:predicted transglutaminase-like cysteine proteinase
MREVRACRRRLSAPAAWRRPPATRLWQIVLFVHLLLVAGLGLIPAAAADASPLNGARMQASFFDSLEVQGESIQAFRKWGDALARSAAETPLDIDGHCSSGMFRTCPYGEWLQFLERSRGLDRWQQLQAVNHEINRRRYVTDMANYGVEDHWASVGDFLLRDSGDCEDYSIAKFLSLKRLGWSDRDLRLVAVKDMQLKIGHAVLIAFHGGRAWLLDNQFRHVVDAREVHHYQPLYSINESAWWRHRPRTWTAAADGSAETARTPAAR